MEIILTIVCLIIAILALCAIVIISGKRKVDILKVRLEEAQKNIDYFLEKKEETLEKVIPLIIASNKRKYGKKAILEDLIKNKNIKRDFIKKDIDLIDYVIIHELCHFYEANHSKKFWDLVSIYYPDYKNARKRLKEV